MCRYPRASRKRGRGQPLEGKIQVVFLPDFEERYAVESKNCLTKNAYALNFRHGWELTDVSSEADSTTAEAIRAVKRHRHGRGCRPRHRRGRHRPHKAAADKAEKSPGDKDRFDAAGNSAYYQRIVRTGTSSPVSIGSISPGRSKGGLMRPRAVTCWPTSG